MQLQHMMHNSCNMFGGCLRLAVEHCIYVYLKSVEQLCVRGSAGAGLQVFCTNYGPAGFVFLFVTVYSSTSETAMHSCFMLRSLYKAIKVCKVIDNSRTVVIDNSSAVIYGKVYLIGHYIQQK